jgi:hypothetical protein
MRKGGIFFVGINPATPIYPYEMDLGNYVHLLTNYDDFIKYYKAIRIEQGKTELSRTRAGMNAFLAWVTSQTELPIFETNVIAYPTANLKELRREPEWVIARGKEIFAYLITSFQPKVFILHGKNTVVNFTEVLKKMGVGIQNNIDYGAKIDQMEQRCPLLEIKYPDGETASILACRHFMYYGSKGESYASFKENIRFILNKL